MKSQIFPHAAVATPHYLATSAGLGVLLDGGNAVDAAVATNLVLAVTSPHLCGVGGDLFALVYAEGQVFGLNSSGRLPMAAELPEDGVVPVHGPGSATVPGAVAGWLALLERFGTRSISELAQPAIRYASDGFTRAPGLERSTRRARGLLSVDPEMAKTFLGTGKLVQPELAETLKELNAFYGGPVAQAAPPPFSYNDFADHRAEWVEPRTARFGNAEVFEMPPNSRGYLALKAIEAMEPLEGLTDEDPEFHLRMIRAIEAATTAGDTVYLCVHDEHGMAVSLNESNFMGWGSGVMIPGTGVHLHNRGAYFTPETYRGGDRPIHTLAPAMALEQGKPKLVFGTMGGEAQIQIHLQLLARIFNLGQDPGTAVSSPRWIKHRDGRLLAEKGLPDIGAEDLPESGVAGHAHVILSTDEGLAAAADPRSDGSAAGY